MTDPTRRRLLKAAALLPLAVACDGWAGEVMRPRSAKSAQASFVIQRDKPGREVSRTLAGLSFETQQLGDKGYFSASNTALVKLFRELNPHGVLRLGGNTSDYTVWSEYHGVLPAQKSHRGGPQQPFVLHPHMLHELAGFLRATGWKLVFGVNLKIGVPAMAAELAIAIKRIVGDDLLAVQIGNEANNYDRTYAAFDAAWGPYAKAIEAVDVPIAGPDSGANTDWVIAYAEQYAKRNQFLSRHYYRGPAPEGTIADMLSGDPAFYREVECIMQAADEVGLPFYLTEANSYYFGGRDGVSNVFASALWGADFMLALATRGVSGIQFHGGTLLSVEASLGHAADTASSGKLAARRNAVTSRYSAIAGDVTLGFQPRPLYHGMQFAQRFAGAHMLPAQLHADGVNLTAYAARRDREVLVALINKDAARDVDVSLRGLQACAAGQLMRLTAPALNNRHDAVFGSAGGGLQTVPDAEGACSVRVPRGSAALVFFQQPV